MTDRLLIAQSVKGSVHTPADGAFLRLFVRMYVFVHRHAKHRDKLNEQLQARILPFVLDGLEVSGVIINDTGKLLSGPALGFSAALIACPIGLKSKSKSLFLLSISYHLLSENPTLIF